MKTVDTITIKAANIDEFNSVIAEVEKKISELNTALKKLENFELKIVAE